MPIPRGVSDIHSGFGSSRFRDFGFRHRVSRHRRWGATTANYSDDCRPYEICSPRRSLAEASWPDVSSALGHWLRLTRRAHTLSTMSFTIGASPHARALKRANIAHPRETRTAFARPVPS